jgi:hypothetical protein
MDWARSGVLEAPRNSPVGGERTAAESDLSLAGAGYRDYSCQEKKGPKYRDGSVGLHGSPAPYQLKFFTTRIRCVLHESGPLHLGTAL